MRYSKHVLIGLIVVGFCGLNGLILPTTSQAQSPRADKKLNRRCQEVPPWRGVIPGNRRFVPTFIDENRVAHAYCDRQTGLVWDAAPEFFEAEVDQRNWNEARIYCANTRDEPWNGQKGGRLPSMAELASLVDTTSTLCTGGGPCLPDDHPFGDNVKNAFYWSASASAFNSSDAWVVLFGDGRVAVNAKDSTRQAWCVRGAMSESVY